MATVNRPAEDQAAIWNGTAGEAWVEMQAVLDRLFAPIEALIVEAVMAKEAREILDVGCGTGATALAVQRALGQSGRVTGVDISEPMLALARTRAAAQHCSARFLLADPEAGLPDAAAFDMIVSRFGVMFFSDPVRAFTNLRRAARPGASMCLVAWRSAAQNPFMTAAERAAAPFLPALPARDPEAPGQFAFGDEGRVRRIVEDSGWTWIGIRPVDIACTLAEGELSRYLARMGPVGRVLPQLDAATRTRILKAMREAFEPYVEGTVARFAAACWIIEAEAPAA